MVIKHSITDLDIAYPEAYISYPLSWQRASGPFAHMKDIWNDKLRWVRVLAKYYSPFPKILLYHRIRVHELVLAVRDSSVREH